MSFEQTFKNIDDLLYKDSGSDSELDYIGQTSWVMFLRYLDELRKLWSLPDTRKKLLSELNEKGYSHEQLSDLKNLVNGHDSDLFDVLNYIAYHKDLVPRFERAEMAKMRLGDYSENQREFLNFVLEQYIEEGVDELYVEKLSPLLTLKYSTIADAKKHLGDIPSIRK